MDAGVRIRCSARALPRALAAGAAALVLLHVAVMLVHYRVAEIPWLIRSLFDLDEEQSFGTWFSVALLLLAACLLHLHARERRAAGDRWARAWSALGWGFLLLSVDELVGLHETLNTVLDLSWVAPGAALVALVGLRLVPFLRQLPRRTLVLFLASGGIYLSGALGVELATEPMERQGRLDTLEYNLSTAAEEGLEMGGVILFLHGLLAHLAREGDAVGELRIER
jgi:hypothetical protein